MDGTLARLQAELESRALLSRMATHGDDPYEKVMLSCLATAYTALCACAGGPLLDALATELARLAQHCAHEAERMRQAPHPSAPEARGARRVALAARALSELAHLKALHPG